MIKAAAPDAVETIGYQIPIFKHGKPLVGMGATKRQGSFYVMSPALVQSLGDELLGYDVSGATIHFPFEKPLPQALVTRIVLARLAENALPRDRTSKVASTASPRAGLADDIAAALDAALGAGVFFDTLAPTYRDQFFAWIDATKRRPEVRAARIDEMIRLLQAGKKSRVR